MDPYDRKVSVNQIETCLNVELSNLIKQHINKLNLRYRILTDKERQSHIESYHKFLEAKIVPSGPIRKNAWVEGWQQNLDEAIVCLLYTSPSPRD